MEIEMHTNRYIRTYLREGIVEIVWYNAKDDYSLVAQTCLMGEGALRFEGQGYQDERDLYLVHPASPLLRYEYCSNFLQLVVDGYTCLLDTTKLPLFKRICSEAGLSIKQVHAGLRSQPLIYEVSKKEHKEFMAVHRRFCGIP